LISFSSFSLNRKNCKFQPCRVLHCSSGHGGERREMKALADVLQINRTFKLCTISQTDQTKGRPRFHISRRLATQIWKYMGEKECQENDAIIISGSGSLSRPFLQFNCSTRLILRLDMRFEILRNEKDPIFKAMMRTLSDRPNVRVVPNNYYEQWHCRNNPALLINLTVHRVIPGLGLHPFQDTITSQDISSARAGDDPHKLTVIKKNLDNQFYPLLLAQTNLSLNLKRAKWGGPKGLKDYNLWHIPYQSSIMALFENLGEGVVYFIPTIKMWRNLTNSMHFSALPYPPQIYAEGLPYADWWWAGYQHLFFYWDSFQELEEIITHKQDLIEKKT